MPATPPPRVMGILTPTYQQVTTPTKSPLAPTPTSNSISSAIGSMSNDNVGITYTSVASGHHSGASIPASLSSSYYMVASDSGAMPPLPHDHLTATPNGIAAAAALAAAAGANGNNNKISECRYGDLCRIVRCPFYHPTRTFSTNSSIGPLMLPNGRRACHSWLSTPTCRFGNDCRDVHDVPSDWKCSNCTGNHRVMDCNLGYCVFARDRKCTWEQRFHQRCPLPHPNTGMGAPLNNITPTSATIPKGIEINAQPIVASYMAHDPTFFARAAMTALGNAASIAGAATLASVAAANSTARPSPISVSHCHNCHLTDHRFAECPHPCTFFQRSK
jgi:hypothetical protein